MESKCSADVLQKSEVLSDWIMRPKVELSFHATRSFTLVWPVDILKYMFNFAFYWNIQVLISAWIFIN